MKRGFSAVCDGNSGYLSKRGKICCNIILFHLLYVRNASVSNDQNLKNSFHTQGFICFNKSLGVGSAEQMPPGNKVLSVC